MQHACTQTEAALPVDDDEPTHLTIAMIEDAFKRDLLGEANRLLNMLNDHRGTEIRASAPDVVWRMIKYTDLELIAGVEHGEPATANAEFVCGYGGRYTYRDMSYQYGRSGANVESVALMAMRKFPEFTKPLAPGLRCIGRYPYVVYEDEYDEVMAGLNTEQFSGKPYRYKGRA